MIVPPSAKNCRSCGMVVSAVTLPSQPWYSAGMRVRSLCDQISNPLSLRIPVTDSLGNPTSLDGYTSLLLFDNFVAESSAGKTAAGFDAMRYADGSYVQTGDFALGRVKITAAVQSHANEYAAPFSGTFEDIVGTYYDPTSSLLMLRMDNLLDDGYGNLLPSQATRVLVTVYLKHAGFANATREITEAQMRNLLGI